MMVDILMAVGIRAKTGSQRILWESVATSNLSQKSITDAYKMLRMKKDDAKDCVEVS